jgi:uncharacterized protein with LGFP repeats
MSAISRLVRTISGRTPTARNERRARATRLRCESLEDREMPAVLLDLDTHGYAVYGAIYSEWAAIGGNASVVGSPTSSEMDAVGGGRVNFFSRGAIYWSPSTGAHEVHGAIVGEYNATGGSAGPLGFPTSDEQAAADGVGRFNTFQIGTIYWSPSTGAHEVQGEIRDKYNALGGPGGILGYPVSDEMAAVGGGRVSFFQRGAIYWSQDTGAHEVHGAIVGEYNATGGSAGRLGLPTSDERPTPDGVGRFNTFQGGSVYWSPSTGAHEIQGVIRDKWAALGWERGPLGYPISDELPGPGGSRVSFFEHGYISWTGSEAVVSVRLPGGYTLTAQRSVVSVTDTLGDGTTSSVQMPADQPAGQQEATSNGLVETIANYFAGKAEDIADGRLRAADMCGALYGLTAYWLTGGSASLPSLLFDAGSAQNGVFYGAIIDDVVAVLKGESKPAVDQVLGTLATLYFSQMTPVGAGVRLGGMYGWELTKEVGDAVGGAARDFLYAAGDLMKDAAGDVRSAAEDVWDTATGWL